MYTTHDALQWRLNMRSKPNDTPPACPTQETQWEKPTTAEATRHDALNNTNVEPSAAPSASYGAQVDGPPRKSSSNRKKEDLPSGERETERAIPVCLLSCWLLCGKEVLFRRGCVCQLRARDRVTILYLRTWASAVRCRPCFTVGEDDLVSVQMDFVASSRWLWVWVSKQTLFYSL